MTQVELVPVRPVVRSLVAEFGLTPLIPKSELRRRAKCERQAAKVAKALTAQGVTLEKLVAACHASANVFTPADANDLSMFGIDYQI